MEFVIDVLTNQTQSGNMENVIVSPDILDILDNVKSILPEMIFQIHVT